jgi:hypothetical protein
MDGGYEREVHRKKQDAIDAAGRWTAIVKRARDGHLNVHATPIRLLAPCFPWPITSASRTCFSQKTYNRFMQKIFDLSSKGVAPSC